MGSIADGGHRSSTFGEALGQQQDILDNVSTSKLVAQGSDLTNPQQCHFLGAQSQLEADLYDQGILGRVPMVFDFNEYLTELVIGQQGRASGLQP